MTQNETTHATYGLVPRELALVPSGARQCSPLIPGSDALEALPQASLDGLTILAPPGTIERNYALAAGLRALKPGAPLIVMAPKDKGGSRLEKEVAAFGCAVQAESKRHHRIVTCARPEVLQSVDAAIEAGAPRLVPPTGLWSQPGIFSWDRLDPGTALLLANLPNLRGHGADFGCGAGTIAKAVLASAAVESLLLLDLDRRAVAMAQKNVIDPRARFLWEDLRAAALPEGLDFVVMNPPFHDNGQEDRSLGQRFIERAAQSLRRGGVCWLTANRHLPYEASLNESFASVTLRAEAVSYKIYEARK